MAVGVPPERGFAPGLDAGRTRGRGFLPLVGSCPPSTGTMTVDEEPPVTTVTQAQWRESFPDIPWDDPIDVSVMRADGSVLTVLACRLCIADVGLKAQDILTRAPGLAVFETPDDFYDHLATRHP